MKKDEVRAITIRQPYVWAITHGTKRIENRVWSPKYRGTLFIHAGVGSGDREYVERLTGKPVPKDLPKGAFVAVCELADVVSKSKDKWFDRGHYGFVLKNVKRLRKPVPAVGRLNLWRPTAAQIKAVMRQCR